MTETAPITAPTPPVEPDAAPRLAALDTLRGIAILAILFPNISDMGASFFAALDGQPQQLGLTAADRAAWWTRELFLTGTARGILEMLFGAGMVILTDRAMRQGGRAPLLGYVWRNLVLLLLGLVHVFVLLWPGDILHTYALAALIALCFRGAPPRLMLSVGLLFAIFQMVFGTLSVTAFARQQADATALQARTSSGPSLSASERSRLADYVALDAQQSTAVSQASLRVVREDRARRGTPAQWAGAAWTFFLYVEGEGYETYWVWEAAGAMLIGAALFRWGVLGGGRRARFYGRMAAIGYLVGLSLRVLALRETIDPVALPLFAPVFGEVARLATTIGHVSLINLLLVTGTGARLLRPFAAAGRTALSIYIAQTVVCLWVLYPPWGLALYGKQGWAALMLTALGVNVALLWGANLWVKYFAIAPVEWAWRSTVARQRLPFRRGIGEARSR